MHATQKKQKPFYKALNAYALGSTEVSRFHCQRGRTEMQIVVFTKVHSLKSQQGLCRLSQGSGVMMVQVSVLKAVGDRQCGQH